MFNWTPLRLATLTKRVRAYNAAITRAENLWRKNGYGNLISHLPKRITVEETKSRIDNVNDFRRIVGYDSQISKKRRSELTRILNKYNKDALAPKFITKDDTGIITTKYTDEQYKLNKRYTKRKAKHDRADLAAYEEEQIRKIKENSKIKNQINKVLEEMPQEDKKEPVDTWDTDEFEEEEYPELYEDWTKQDNTDLVYEDSGEYDYSIEDIDEQTKYDWNVEDSKDQIDTGSLNSKYKAYIETWTRFANFHNSMSGYGQLIEDLLYLKDVHPRFLMTIFNMGYDEADLKFISPAKNSPYVNLDYRARHNRAVNFWHQKRLEADRRKGFNGQRDYYDKKNE